MQQLNSKKLKTIGKILLAVSVFAAIYYHSQYIDERVKKNYQVLHNSEIDGFIIYKSQSTGMNYFKVHNKPDKFGVWVLHSIDSEKSFSDVVERGDKIVKPAKIDTITVIKKEVVYKFPVQKI